MAGSGRQFFDESEKLCLQELVLKYKINSVATTMGSSAAKKAAWTRLTEEYNSIETNSKRTEAQLKKCWDNMKTRRKSVLAQEKRQRMRTGGGPFNPNLPGTSDQVQVLEDALADQTDVELVDVIDSDYLTSVPETAEALIIPDVLTDTPLVPYPYSETRTDLNESAAERVYDATTPRLSESRLIDHGVAQSQGARNIRTRVIQEEFSIRQKSYDRSQKRDEELHKLRISEKEWMVKAAEEYYYKTKAERQAAEELLLCNRAQKEEAELRLEIFKRQN